MPPLVIFKSSIFFVSMYTLQDDLKVGTTFIRSAIARIFFAILDSYSVRGQKTEEEKRGNFRFLLLALLWYFWIRDAGFFLIFICFEPLILQCRH